MSFDQQISNDKGQAMVECIIVSLVLVVLLFAMQLVADGYLIKHKTITSSRYAAWRLALVPETSPAEVEANVRDLFFGSDAPPLDQGAIDLGHDPAELLDEEAGFVTPLLEETGTQGMSVAYQVRYERSWQNSAALAAFPDHFAIGSFHEVDSSTWSGNATAIHDAYDLMTGGIEEALRGQPGMFE